MKKDNETFLCIIPARGGSKGIVDKNIIDINGFPLISYSMKAAKKSKIFNRIIVSTDFKEIVRIANDYGVEVPFVRPDSLATDDSRVEETICHALKYIEKYDKRYDYVCLLQPTSPLVEHDDIKKAKGLLFSKKGEMVVSVAKSPINVSWAKIVPDDLSMKNFSSGIYGTNKQCFKNVYYLNGAIYLGKWDIFYEKKNYYEQNTYAYIMPYERSIDIDNELDVKLASFFLKESIKVKK